MATARALQLKEEGNKSFQSADYTTAEALYSKAINIDPTNPLLYTNRAMSRLKLHLYEAVIPDCLASLDLLSENMKAYYYLAQAEIELGRVGDAYKHATMAYELCSGVKSGVVDRAWERSLGVVGQLVLRCKKELWQEKESARLGKWNALRDEVVGMFEKQKEAELAREDVSETQRAEVNRKWEEKERDLLSVWEKAAEGEGKRREVPDWAIDNITFAVMHDPVITKNGQSYDRASIMEHLRRSPTDPLTREPLRPDELRPNLGLKAACSEFLDENGWAVDW